jgi:hypothetical protein
MVKYLSFYNSSFALRCFLNVNGKATMKNTNFILNTMKKTMELICFLGYYTTLGDTTTTTVSRL